MSFFASLTYYFLLYTKIALSLTVKQLEFTATASNIFDADYIETGFTPMPPSNVLFGMRFNFN